MVCGTHLLASSGFGGARGKGASLLIQAPLPPPLQKENTKNLNRIKPNKEILKKRIFKNKVNFVDCFAHARNNDEAKISQIHNCVACKTSC
ncbi:MAG: hypothetical protein K2P17_03095 [Helicobacteraceae bacterium]|nr:hypothetical protein [Helicobacteraceae bacterium]